MSAITVKRHIDAPVDEVFERALDFADAPRVIQGIRKVEMLTPGPVAVGTRFRETRVMYGREAVEEMEVTALDPPHGYSLGCENHGSRYHSEVRFQPNGLGTDVTLSFEATPLTFVAKVMSFLLKPMMKTVASACGKDLDDLKAAIEQGADPGA